MAIRGDMGTGVKVAVSSLGLGGLPQCAICHKSVDEIVEYTAPDRDVLLLVARCHGKQDVLEIPRQVLMDATLSSLDIGGLAFDPTKRLAGADGQR